jgi:hypothetical protein
MQPLFYNPTSPTFITRQSTQSLYPIQNDLYRKATLWNLKLVLRELELDIMATESVLS